MGRFSVPFCCCCSRIALRKVSKKRDSCARNPPGSFSFQKNSRKAKTSDVTMQDSSFNSFGSLFLFGGTMLQHHWYRSVLVHFVCSQQSSKNWHMGCFGCLHTRQSVIFVQRVLLSCSIILVVVIVVVIILIPVIPFVATFDSF